MVHWHCAFVVIELTIQYLVTLSFLRQFTCNHIIQLNLSQLLEHGVPVEVRMAKSTRNDKRKKSVEFWKLLFKRRDGTFFYIYLCVCALMSPMHVCTLFSRDARSKCSLNRGMRWNAVEWETIGRLSEESNKVEKMPIIMIIDPLFRSVFFRARSILGGLISLLPQECLLSAFSNSIVAISVSHLTYRFNF